MYAGKWDLGSRRLISGNPGDVLGHEWVVCALGSKHSWVHYLLKLLSGHRGRISALCRQGWGIQGPRENTLMYRITQYSTSLISSPQTFTKLCRFNLLRSLLRLFRRMLNGLMEAMNKFLANVLSFFRFYSENKTKNFTNPYRNVLAIRQ